MCQPPYFIKKIISTNCSRVKDPHFLAQKQQKMAIFEKADYWGLKYPLEVRVQHETCGTICRTPVPAILNPKIRPGQQEGSKTAKSRYIWYLQKYPILAVFGPSCQPGRLFIVQNGWKRCPAYRYMFHVGLAPLGGLLGPNT